ncbi:MAG: phosphatidate cytidylyltransferase [Desulfosoma sp.]
MVNTPWSSHAKRWVTGLGLALPLVAMLLYGPLWLWVLAVTLAAAVGLWEYEMMAQCPPVTRRDLVFSLVVGAVFPPAAWLFGPAGILASAVGAVFALWAKQLARPPLTRDAFHRGLVTLGGWFYVALPLAFVMLLGALESGRAWVFFVLVVIVSGDVGAYYTGKTLGRRKLYEAVSPKKTVEGALGGLAASAVVGTIFGVLFLRDTGASVAALGAVSILTELVGQAGDLMESLLKRMAGCKDSSALLPGHGGLLDRLDSLLFAFPTVWVYAQAV